LKEWENEWTKEGFGPLRIEEPIRAIEIWTTKPISTSNKIQKQKSVKKKENKTTPVGVFRL
jgi:hypothetical protein